MALSETSLMSHLSNAAAKAVDEISQLGLVQGLPPQELDDAVLSLLESGGMPDPYKHLWEQYSLPSEVAGWLAAFVQVAEACAASIVLSDMSLAGAPMVYVNDAFCEFTGYTKREVLVAMQLGVPVALAFSLSSDFYWAASDVALLAAVVVLLRLPIERS
ncbi:hypothetical protein EMIHUDRAFT_213082 [Emiliania huxleyi CCMP1516]|uniref:PAS domain-containing protein n=2 Tax=Emiliania huxleyi TaxID=2903 RepID=A0A0D3INM9_EMIH1|nr:hypothetical protein EMIHUDRAFT_213082 [Emiliania huxleyi CCMP1516]EOD12864.1 hypothetical protein EMIHUDRAFT_213082 [Emiliania huxleyi CCMP1516]|eukprot:XP_005765293.1 hypothetical protein EMIHUDRAFT_213082 [Emiliania huxleyi CCMP1516]